jgi:hypothetical protein
MLLLVQAASRISLFALRLMSQSMSEWMFSPMLVMF